MVSEDGAAAASGGASGTGLQVGMNTVVEFGTAVEDRAVVRAESTRYAGSRPSLSDRHPVREEDRIVGVVVAGGVRGGGG